MTDPGFWASIDRSAPGATEPGPQERPVLMGLDAATLDFQRRHIRMALERNAHSVSRAADALGQGASGRSVAVEFGSLVLIGLVVGLVIGPILAAR